MKKPINEVILDLIKKHGGTDSSIADKLGISKQRLSQYKNKIRKPDVDFITRWKKTFGDDLIELSEGKSTTVDSNERSMHVEPDEYRSWIGDLRSDIMHLREVNMRYLKIIENLSVKVAAT